MHSVYLITGSNLGDRAAQLDRALEILNERAGHVKTVSQVYETEAWGIQGLPAHLNQAVRLETLLSPEALLTVLQQAEAEMGRVRQERWGVRAIDIDIIYYDRESIQLPQLTIPHPLMQVRNFVLAPLAEIAPDYRHPVLHKTNAALLQESPDTLKVKVLAEPG